MPVILEEMDEFVNWDQAGPPATGMAGVMGMEMDVLPSSILPSATDPMHEFDLALENVEGDDFSFWALEHFENTISPTLNSAMDTTTTTAPLAAGVSREGPFEDDLETPDVPCSNCRTGGYQCKRIPEGQHKGYCTSCVALRSQCSFGSESRLGVADGFPSNTWPLMGDHPMVIPDAHVENCSAGSSAVELPASNLESASSQAKAGARFSRESVKILKNWLSTHSKHPYPNDDEKELLQRQTGLNKLQITNWLANTRRRNKNAIAQRSTSPGVRSWSKPIDIPSRRGMPSFELMNPLQRWQHSPPENEPASVQAIANAINTSGTNLSSGLSSPYSLNLTDDGSGRSLCDSAISSANTSHSSTNSFASGYSFNSRGSLGSGGSMPRGRRRRRRKATAPAIASIPLRQPLKTFQCTFCTETFRTKHDWQRHEKSLHLSLERWVCSPSGPTAFNPESNQVSCVFCGLVNPDAAHIENHDHSACQERSLADRTFYRKDHMRQHLKLVHHTKYLGWSMDQWKVTTPEIRSRCGFCGIIMDTWSVRVDHLAEHFKRGKSMADWKGDWGFEDPVLNMVENSIPPYLIHDERNSPDPFEASHPPTSARNAYELIKTELMTYIDEKREKGAKPADGALLDVAHRLLHQTQTVSRPCVGSTGSWLQDLLLQSASNERLVGWADKKKTSTSQLTINGKGNIFELDPMELELDVYVKARRLLGLTAMDSELQAEACNIIRRMDDASHEPSEEVVDFFVRLISSSTSWLACFRQRAHLPRSEDVGVEGKRSKDPNKIDSTIHNPSRLEFELAEYVREQRALGAELTDADLQKRARIIIYEYDDGWNQTAADDSVWLTAFKERYLVVDADPCMVVKNLDPLPISHAGMWPEIWSNFPPSQQQQPSQSQQLSQSPTLALSLSGASSSSSSAISPTAAHSSASCTQSTSGKNPSKLLGDVNCYQRLARELKKYVASAMSPNNPNCHVPSDQELQHQARWIIYEDDDPWNTTSAENAEWLLRFKLDCGILTNEDTILSGLPETISWNINQGGSGFAPPYAIPNPGLVNANVNVPGLQSSNDLHTLTLRDGTKPFTAPGATVNRFVQALHTRHDPPATVFCSRELEKGLIEFVSTGLSFPSDEALKRRAKEILGTSGTTAADDDVLLNKFKDMMKGRLGLDQGQQQPQQQPRQQESSQVQADTITIQQMSDEAIDEALQEMDFDFDFIDMGVSVFDPATF